MTSQTRPSTPPLDFSAAASPQAFLPCSDCRQAIRTYYYALNVDERPVCAKCKPPYAERIARGAGPGALARVLLYGGGAAAGLAVLLGGILSVLGFLQIFAGIAVGWCIARAINAASGDFFDRRYQVIAAVLTYVTIGVASVLPVLVAAARYEPPKAVATAPTIEERKGAAADADNPWSEVDSLVEVIDANDGRIPVEREPTPAQQLAEGSAISRVANALLMIALLPVLGLLAHGIYAAGVGVFVLGFGIYKAWEMTGQTVAHELSGPHRVGTGPIVRDV